ncbi:hypothetical protein EV11_1866 [Prochlorococcus sp. SS52]|nr:hypothetical protein EV08_0988 [Prochlorococcus marinus str. SS2]KGG24074.1 hypothetical protein EV09_0678 [Prochlorococcus marinus str. SS35]KGG31667.1 hypothetical protein EV10_1764 [Prochlorococcus marinus str. SS51]KGG34734.1 hypothetical protein EV11_1866 [Prochlorococcus sp. SS52]
MFLGSSRGRTCWNHFASNSQKLNLNAMKKRYLKISFSL